MKKYKVLLALFLSVIKLFPESNIYDELLEKLLLQNEKLFIMQSEGNIVRRSILNEKLKWLPKLSLNASSKAMGFIRDKSANYFTVNANLILRQKLLMGAYLELFAKNNVDMIKRNDLKHKYSFSAGASLHIPLYIFTPLIFTAAFKADTYSQKNTVQSLALKEKIVTNSLIAETVFLIGEYFLQEKEIALKRRKLSLLESVHDANTVLWKEGRLSTLELNEKTNLYESEKSKLILLEMLFETLKTKMHNANLLAEDETKNIVQWIEDWEDLVKSIKVEALNEYELEKLQLDSLWNDKVNKAVSFVPNLILACNFDSVDPLTKKYTKDFLASIRETFNNKNDFRWTVSLGLNLKFDPFRESSQVNQNFKDNKVIYKNQKAVLNKNYNEALEEVKNNMYALKEIVKSKNESIKISERRLEEANLLYKNGRLSKNDFDIQKLYLEEARLDLLRSRLKHISFLIHFY